MADIAESTPEKSSQTSQMKLEKKFGQSPVFVASTLLENGGVPRDASPASLLREAIQVISCGYEDKTEWGKEVSKQETSNCLSLPQASCTFSPTYIKLLYCTRLAGYMVL